ncbi:hypothetical protein MKW98_019349, partial [Papaver atlanticum]
MTQSVKSYSRSSKRMKCGQGWLSKSLGAAKAQMAGTIKKSCRRQQHLDIKKSLR